MPQAIVDEALTTFERFLRGKQLKMTDQRRNLVRAVLEHQGHFTAEDLHQRLRSAGDSVSLATVYRALSLLEEASIVQGHDFADGQRRYERALRREHHDHMICVDCRAVVEFQNQRIEDLQEQVVRQHGFRIHDHTLTLFVTCNAWREKQRCDRRERRMRGAR
jgi:Fur family ferric uptake transcriptional regulator